MLAARPLYGTPRSCGSWQEDRCGLRLRTGWAQEFENCGVHLWTGHLSGAAAWRMPALCHARPPQLTRSHVSSAQAARQWSPLAHGSLFGRNEASSVCARTATHPPDATHGSHAPAGLLCEGGHDLAPPQASSRHAADAHSSGRLPLNARQLTSKLAGASSLQQLEVLVKRHASELNAVHISALLTRAVRLKQQLDAPIPASEQPGAHGSWSQQHDAAGLNGMRDGYHYGSQHQVEMDVSHESSSMKVVVQTAIQLLMRPKSRSVADAGSSLQLQYPGSAPAAAGGWGVSTQGPNEGAEDTSLNSSQDEAAAMGGMLFSAGVRELSNIAWALAKLGRGARLAPHVAAAVEAAAHTPHRRSTHREQVSVQDSSSSSSTTTDAYTPGAPQRGAVGRRTGTRLMSALDAAEPRALSMLLWAFATWGHRAPRALEPLCASLLRCLGSTPAWELSTAVWALATLQHHPQRCALLPALSSGSACRVAEQTVVGLSNLVWGLSMLLRPEEMDPELLQAISQRVVGSAAQLAAAPREAACIMMSLHRVGHADPHVWHVVQEQVGARGLVHWDPASLACILNAYAASSRPCPQLLSALEQRLMHAPESMLHSGGVDSSYMNDAARDLWPHYEEQAGQASMSSDAAARGDAGGTVGPGRGASDALLQSPRALCQIMWSLGKLAVDSRRAAAKRAADMASSQGSIHSRPGYSSAQLQLSSGLGLAGDRHARLLVVLADAATEHIESGRVPPGYVAQAMWAWTVGATGLHPMLAIAVQQLPSRVGALAPSELVMAFTALTATHIRSAAAAPDKAFERGAAECWRALGQHASEVLPRMPAPHLAALCMAAAQQGVGERPVYGLSIQLVLQAAAAHAQQLLSQGGGVQARPVDSEEERNGQEAQDAEQAAFLRSADEGLEGAGAPRHRSLHALAALATQAPVRVVWAPHHRPTPAVLVSLLTSLTAVGLRSHALNTATTLVCASPNGAGQLSPRLLHQLLCAAAASGAYTPRLYTRLAARVAQHVDSLQAVQLVDVLCAMARARHYEVDLVEAICQAVLVPAALYSLSPEYVARLMWAVGFLGAGVFVEWRLPARALCTAAPHMSLDALAGVLWSLAVQQHILFTSYKGAPDGPSHAPVAGRPQLQQQPAVSSAALSVLRAVLQQVATLNPRDVAATPHAALAMAQGLSWLMRSDHEAAAAAVALAMEQQLPPKLVHVLRFAWLGQAARSSRQDMAEEQDAVQQEAQREAISAASANSRGETQTAGMLLTHRHVVGRQRANPDLARQPGAGPPAALEQVGRSRSQVSFAWSWQQALQGLVRRRQRTGATRQDILVALERLGVQASTDHVLSSTQATSTLLPQPSVEPGKQQQHQVTRMVVELDSSGSDVVLQLQSQNQPEQSVAAAVVQGQQGGDGGGTRGGGDEGSRAARAAVTRAQHLLPVRMDELVLLPSAQPRRVALLLALRGSFAANVQGEPLGALFAETALLEQSGWLPVVLDVGVWRSLCSTAEQDEYLEELLKGWGVSW